MPAMAAVQALHGWQIHRHRRPAPTFVLWCLQASRLTAPPLWERACPRWRRARHCTAGRHTAIAGKPAPTFVLWCLQASRLTAPPSVGAGLPAMAAVQALHGWQTHRHRRQASSYICFVVSPGLLSGRDAAWGALFGHLRRLQLAITRFLPWRLASYIAASARAKRLSRVASSAVRLARPWLTVTL